MLRVNEHRHPWEEGLTVGEVRDRHKPGADVLILNSFPTGPETPVADGDQIVLIRRGEVPSRAELDYQLAARHSPGVHEAMRRSVVGIAGVGGLGSLVALCLARIGVGRIIAADFDVVEPSNLGRQQYEVGQIGMTKTAAIAENIAAANPNVSVETFRRKLDRGSVPVIFDGARVVVECLDTPEGKAMMLACARTTMRQVPFVMASGVAGIGRGDELRTVRRFSNVFVVGDGTSEAGPGSGLMAPRVAIAAGLQANTAVRLLLGEEP